MPKTIAFLRAINVPHRVVRMDDLRQMFAALGFTGVTTFIQSGNVIFDSPEADPSRLEKQIEQHLESELGFAVPTFLRPDADLIALTQYTPFPQLDPADDPVQYVTFLHETPKSEQAQRLTALENPVDSFQIYQNHVFWLRRRKVGESQISNAALEKALAVPGTTRNMTTIHKIAALVSPTPAR